LIRGGKDNNNTNIIVMMIVVVVRLCFGWRGRAGPHVHVLRAGIHADCVVCGAKSDEIGCPT
jgi:hypothetical protein